MGVAASSRTASEATPPGPTHHSGCRRGTGERMHLRTALGGFSRGSVVRGRPANAGDMSSIPDLGRPHVPRSN